MLPHMLLVSAPRSNGKAALSATAQSASRAFSACGSFPSPLSAPHVPRTRSSSVSLPFDNRRQLLQSSVSPVNFSSPSSLISPEWKSARCFSTSTPYLVLPNDVIEESASGNTHVRFNLLNPSNQEFLKLPNQKLPPELQLARRKGSSHGWFALMNRHDCGFYLTDMYTPSAASSSSPPKIIPLPSVESLPFIVRINHEAEGGGVRNIIMDPRTPYPQTPNHLSRCLVERLALSCPPDSDENIKNCTVAILCPFLRPCVAFCRPGHKVWTCVKWGRQSHKSDIIYSKRDKVFYSWDISGHMLGWSVNNPDFCPKLVLDTRLRFTEPEITESEQNTIDLCFDRCYLVETCTGEIFSVRRYIAYFLPGDEKNAVDPDDHVEESMIETTQRFSVYKLDLKKKTAEYMESIGDNCLFLGSNESFCLSINDFPGLRRNCIYFTDDDPYFESPEIHRPKGGHDMGIYDLADQTVTKLYESDKDKIIPRPIWIAPTSV